jgi:competence protein ComEA
MTRDNLALILVLLLVTLPACTTRQKQLSITEIPPNPTAINLNTASVSELEKLPGVGDDLARRIIEHREKYNRFERTEELLLLRGISEKKFRELRPLIKTD